MAAAVGREEGEEDEQGRKKRLWLWLRLRLQHCSWERKERKGEKRGCGRECGRSDSDCVCSSGSGGGCDSCV
ncbi:unnamed protein product [Musa acuminata subsp. malaccensis]|uniref:(wild Malaysian banana) hypothetical protein n=1 Tax=Musa acuminata subsp. malaccensis TaxID=214687 RepID=A0A8D7AXD8_MUSAM|nr:unnamed protein product [Musa acuminata subsp. malaccensis]